jgi:hypothetical protein
LRAIRSGRLSLPPGGRRGANEYSDQRSTDPDYLLSLRSLTSLFVIAGLVPATHGTSKVRLSPVIAGRTSVDSSSTHAEARGEGRETRAGWGASVRKMVERDTRSRDNFDMCLAPSPGSQLNQIARSSFTNSQPGRPTLLLVIAGLVPATHGTSGYDLHRRASGRNGVRYV